MWPEKTVETMFVTKETLVWRMALAVFWNIIIQVIFLSWFIFIINISVFDPYIWFVNWFRNFASMGTWLKICPLIVIIFAQGVLCSKDYITGPSYYRTRLEMIRKVVSRRNLVTGSLHVFVGITIAYVYTSFCGPAYNSLTVPCTSQSPNATVGLCLVEKKFFLICSGIWTGLYYFLSSHIFGTRNLVFPPIQQYKFIQVKANFVQNLKQSMSDTLFPTLLFLIFYYLRGGYVRESFCNLISLNFITDPIDSLFEIVNLTMILFLWFLASLFFVTLRLMELLFNIHLTERCKFPITSPVPLTFQGSIMLPDALGMSKVPIIQYLGYLDLFVLSEKEAYRREELFMLSQPGGHPHSWNKVSQQCFSIIKSFTSELDKTLVDPDSSVVAGCDAKYDKLQNITPCVKTNIQNLSAANVFNCATDQRTPLQRSIHEKVGTYIDPDSIVTGYNTRYDKLHHMSHTKHNIRNLSATDTYGYNYRDPRTILQQTVNENIKAFFRKSVFAKFWAYFFDESQENKIKYLLCTSQPIVWAVQSLSYLACTSLTEDKYGIVQKDLINIITSLLHLKQTLEKVPKSTTTMFKRTSNVVSNMCDVYMRTVLKTAVKRSLYKIAIVFRPYIKDIGLPADSEQQMMAYIEFREV